ncbi:MAG: PaaI family thioesterase [Acidimicrobiales bacterium]|nr:PaaI family thioesterase [Acidimicrobiales bacterium]
MDAPHDDPLLDAARRVVRGVRVSEVDAQARTQAASLLAEAATLLESVESPGPFWQTGFTSFDQFDLDAEPTTLFPYSPAMGERSPAAPRVELTVGDDKVVRGTATFAEHHNGPPFDTCHGGVIAMVYDDLVGLAAMVGAGGGMTANLSIDYRAPTPLFEPIELRAWLTEHEGRKFWARGEMRHGDVLLSQARGLFVQPTGFPAGAGTG